MRRLRELRLEQIYRRTAQGLRQFIERDDRRVAPAPLQIAEILLGEARADGELLLSQAQLLPSIVHIPPDEAPHIHDAMVGGNGWPSLSTIICALAAHPEPVEEPQ